MLQIPPGYCQVQFKFHQGNTGKPNSCAVGYALSDVLTQTQVNAISTTIAPKFKAILNTGGSYDGVVVRIGSDGPESELTSATSAGAGTRSAALCPPQVVVVLAKKTALRGRKFRGRCFVGDVSETQVGDGGALSTSEQTLFQDLATTMNSSLGAGPTLLNAVLLHSSSTVPTPLTVMTADLQVGTLRRRYKR